MTSKKPKMSRRRHHKRRRRPTTQTPPPPTPAPQADAPIDPREPTTDCPDATTHHRLSTLHAEATTTFPGIWRKLAATRDMRGTSLPTWASWCWVPMAATASFSLEYFAKNKTRGSQPSPRLSNAPALLSALGAWRLGKVVLRFDHSLTEALNSTDIDDHVPLDALYRLPAWAVYVIDDFDVDGSHINGWFAHLEHDANTGRPELRILLDTGSPDDKASIAGLIPIPVYLDRPDLQTALHDMALVALHTRMTGTTGLNIRSDRLASPPNDIAPLVDIVRRCVTRLLYVCSDEPDLCHSTAPNSTLTPTGRGSSRKPWTAALTTNTWDVGYRVGASLRQMRSEGSTPGTNSGTTPRPHWRRAHWHTYRVGPGRTQSRLRWIAPTPVGVSDLDALPIVERPVEPR